MTESRFEAMECNSRVSILYTACRKRMIIFLVRLILKWTIMVVWIVPAWNVHKYNLPGYLPTFFQDFLDGLKTENAKWKAVHCQSYRLKTILTCVHNPTTAFYMLSDFRKIPDPLRPLIFSEVQWSNSKLLYTTIITIYETITIFKVLSPVPQQVGSK